MRGILTAFGAFAARGLRVSMKTIPIVKTSSLGDVVHDLLKGALIARAAKRRHHGFDAGSAREPLAARFYDVALQTLGAF